MQKGKITEKLFFLGAIFNFSLGLRSREATLSLE